jgi:hypothetical protein
LGHRKGREPSGQAKNKSSAKAVIQIKKRPGLTAAPPMPNIEV